MATVQVEGIPKVSSHDMHLMSEPAAYWCLGTY